MSLPTRSPVPHVPMTFLALGKPQPKGSTRAFMCRGRPLITSTNPHLRAWEKIVAKAAQAAEVPLLPAEPVTVGILFLLARPKGVAVKRRPWPVVKPDVDKLARAVLDALTGIAYTDDSQVVQVSAKKAYVEPGVLPGAVITIGVAA